VVTRAAVDAWLAEAAQRVEVQAAAVEAVPVEALAREGAAAGQPGEGDSSGSTRGTERAGVDDVSRCRWGPAPAPTGRRLASARLGRRRQPSLYVEAGTKASGERAAAEVDERLHQGALPFRLDAGAKAEGQL
jgi:hypothetical protein